MCGGLRIFHLATLHYTTWTRERWEKANQPGRFMLRPLLVALALQLASGFVLYTPATRSLELQHPRHAAVTSGLFDIFKESVGPLATHLRR